MQNATGDAVTAIREIARNVQGVASGTRMVSHHITDVGVAAETSSATVREVQAVASESRSIAALQMKDAPMHIIVLGAGVAGPTTAHCLARPARVSGRIPSTR